MQMTVAQKWFSWLHSCFRSSRWLPSVVGPAETWILRHWRIEAVPCQLWWEWLKKDWYLTTRDLDYSKQCIKCVEIYNLNVQWYCFRALDHATKVFCSIAARHPIFLPWLADKQCSWGTSSRETMQLNRLGLGFNMGYMGYKVVIPFDTVYAQEFQCCFPAQSLAFKFCLSEFRWKIGRDLWPQRLKPQWVNWWVEVSEHCTTVLVNDGDASVPRHL